MYTIIVPIAGLVRASEPIGCTPNNRRNTTLNNYTLCLKNGIKFAANQRNGRVLITMHGYINLSGKPKQTICERTTRAFLVGTVCEASLKTEENGRMRLRNHKLISLALACEWLEKDNPELAKAIDGDLMGWLSQPQDLSQFHKAKAAEIVAEIEIISTTELALPANNLERFDRDGIELVINTRTGEAFATQSGYGRMVGLSRQAISQRFKTVNQEGLKTAEITTGTGLKTVNLIPAKLCFKWALKDNPELAEAMGIAGATIYMHQLAGFKIDSEAISKPEPKPTPPPQSQLTPADRIKLASEADKLFEKYGMDTNPRFRQSAQDFIGDILGLNQNTLPAPDAPKWYGVVERAEQLGYPVALVVKHRSPLGRWVAGKVSGGHKESRLCNGTERPINLYPFSPQLDEAIASYFATHQFPK